MIPKKLENYISKIKFNDTYKILDIGGINSYYETLKTMFSFGDIYILNINVLDIDKIDRSIISDATYLPFKNETCDIIMSFDLIEHLIDPDNFISESFRVLKKGGWFIIATPNLNDFYSRITFIFGYTPFSYNPSNAFRVALPLSKIGTSVGHKSVFPYKGLKELLSIHGFDIINSDGYSYTDYFYLESNPEKKDRGVGFYNIRILLSKILPISMQEGMLFITRKK